MTPDPFPMVDRSRKVWAYAVDCDANAGGLENFEIRLHAERLLTKNFHHYLANQPDADEIDIASFRVERSPVDLGVIGWYAYAKDPALEALRSAARTMGHLEQVA